jgi:hypothetical protein
VIRIEADGYQPAVSRDIKIGEGSVSLNFELTTGENVDGVVLTPAGQPAGKAKVAVGIAGSAIAIRNGDILNLNADLQEADARGHFHFPPQLPGYFLVITHPSGYAKYQPGPHSNRRTTLDPWTRVEGILRVAGKPKANVPMWIYRNDARSGDDVPYISTSWDEKTSPDGRFVFERVAAGKGQIGPRLNFTADKRPAEATSARLIRAKFPLGKTVQIDLAGNGRRVVGKLRPPPGYDKPVPWYSAMIQVAPTGAEGRAPNVYFLATVGPDGAFQIDDVPAGEFLFDATIILSTFPGGHLSHRFFVPALASGPSAEPFDLGELALSR